MSGSADQSRHAQAQVRCEFSQMIKTTETSATLWSISLHYIIHSYGRYLTLHVFCRWFNLYGQPCLSPICVFDDVNITRRFSILANSALYPDRFTYSIYPSIKQICELFRNNAVLREWRGRSKNILNSRSSSYTISLLLLWLSHF